MTQSNKNWVLKTLDDLRVQQEKQFAQKAIRILREQGLTASADSEAKKFIAQCKKSAGDEYDSVMLELLSLTHAPAGSLASRALAILRDALQSDPEWKQRIDTLVKCPLDKSGEALRRDLGLRRDRQFRKLVLDTMIAGDPEQLMPSILNLFIQPTAEPAHPSELLHTVYLALANGIGAEKLGALLHAVKSPSTPKDNQEILRLGDELLQLKRSLEYSQADSLRLESENKRLDHHHQRLRSDNESMRGQLNSLTDKLQIAAKQLADCEETVAQREERHRVLLQSSKSALLGNLCGSIGRDIEQIRRKAAQLPPEQGEFIMEKLRSIRESLTDVYEGDPDELWNRA